MSNPLRERLWLYRIRTFRDEKAFTELHAEYVPRIYRFVLFKVSNQDDAHEITDDVFLKAWQHVVGGKPVTHLSGLLYSIARFACIDHYKQRRLETVSLDAVAEPTDIRVANALGVSEELRETMAAIAKLKEEYRDILMMRHIDGLSMNEIATALGKTNGNVRVLMYRAKNALKDSLLIKE